MRLGDELDLIIEETDNIDITPSGKTKMLIQKLNISNWLKLYEH